MGNGRLLPTAEIETGNMAGAVKSSPSAAPAEKLRCEQG